MADGKWQVADGKRNGLLTPSPLLRERRRGGFFFCFVPRVARRESRWIPMNPEERNRDVASSAGSGLRCAQQKRIASHPGLQSYHAYGVLECLEAARVRKALWRGKRRLLR